MNCRLTRNRDGEYIDKFDNRWRKPNGLRQGQQFHWDVQLSLTGKESFGKISSSENHINVLPNGRKPH